jgi:hypothetical protein
VPKRALEIADIFRAYGPAWRGANKGVNGKAKVSQRAEQNVATFGLA